MLHNPKEIGKVQCISFKNLDETNPFDILYDIEYNIIIEIRPIESTLVVAYALVGAKFVLYLLSD